MISFFDTHETIQYLAHEAYNCNGKFYHVYLVCFGISDGVMFWERYRSGNVDDEAFEWLVWHEGQLRWMNANDKAAFGILSGVLFE